MNDEQAFDASARAMLQAIEDALQDVDPDQVEVSSSDGVLRLDARDGTRIVINSHRAARQIWMAAVASAWHFDPPQWVSPKSGEMLWPTLEALLRRHAGVALPMRG